MDKNLNEYDNWLKGAGEYPLNLYKSIFVDAKAVKEGAKNAVEEFIKTFSETEQNAIRMLYEQHMTYNEVSEKLGLSLDDLKTAVAHALRNLRHPSCSQKIKDFADFE